MHSITFQVTTEYLVNGGVGWQCAIKDSELSFQPLRDVIPAAARVNHSRKHLDINNVGEISWLV